MPTEISPFLASNPLHPCIRALLTAPDGSFSATRLHAIAGRRAQHVFSTAVLSDVLTQQLLSTASPLSTTACDRVRHAAAPLAHLPFTTYYVPTPSALSNTETQLLYCHRLGIPLPFIRPPLRHHCYHTCPYYPPRILSRPHTTLRSTSPTSITIWRAGPAASAIVVTML